MDMENLIKPAIVIVGYNRVDCIERLLSRLNMAEYPINSVNLIISLDYSDKTDTIIKKVKEIGWKHGPLEIITNKPRLGLKKHIIKCGDLSEKYGAVIILEDDLLVSKTFYDYVFQAVNYYKLDPRIAGISLYSHGWNGYSNYQFMPQSNGFDTYLGKFSITWGQCWTSNQWKNFKNWYERNQVLAPKNENLPRQIEHWGENSWGRYFVTYINEANLYYVIPYVSHSTNFSEAGEHNGRRNSAHQVMLDCSKGHKDYRFPKFEDSIKYDVFFERELDDFNITGICGRDICVNLNSIRRNTGNKKYLLTTNNLIHYKLISSFGLEMRPIEANVINNCQGNEIYLYECNTENEKLKDKIETYARIKYEFYNHGWIRSFYYGGRKFFERATLAIKIGPKRILNKIRK